MDGDKGVVFEHVLEAVVAGELDGVELSQGYFASFPLEEKVVEHVVAAVGLALDYFYVALGADFEGDAFAVGRHAKLVHLHLYKSILPSPTAKHCRPIKPLTFYT